MITLGIETSCDETSVAVLEDGRILANEIYTQEMHTAYGGVVPEIASRAHLLKVAPLLHSVLEKSGTHMQDIGQIAVTDSPGLAGALLVGIGFALGLRAGRGIPLTGINHLEGHIYSAFLEHATPQFPLLALVVSGGHTALYRIDQPGHYRCVGKTVDDAAGEAFDKVGKLVGFPYPAGRAIEEESRRGDPASPLRFPVARVSGNEMDFSFSGLKTAVRYFINGKKPDEVAAIRPTICRAFQEAVVESLVRNCTAAARSTGISCMVLVGGVACNGRLRQAIKDAFPGEVIFPSPRLCTDNAAMIALAGYDRFQRGETRSPKMDPNGQIG
jgi:N6-L-threonylcarbamoyladenine synthase